MQSRERVAVFIDGSNFYHGMRATFGSVRSSVESDDLFKKLVSALAGNRMLVFVRYYNAPLDRRYDRARYDRQQSFFSKLRRIPGFSVVLNTLRKSRRADGSIEFRIKGDDIHLATDLISNAYEDHYDTAVLVSGDGDFAPAVMQVQKLGKKVENAFFRVSHSSFLKRICDKSVNLDSLLSVYFTKEEDN